MHGGLVQWFGANAGVPTPGKQGFICGRLVFKFQFKKKELDIQEKKHELAGYSVHAPYMSLCLHSDRVHTTSGTWLVLQ